MKQKFISLSPTLGNRTSQFVAAMRRVARNLSRCEVLDRQSVISEAREEARSFLRGPLRTEDLGSALAINVVLDLLTIGWAVRVRKGTVELAPPEVGEAEPAETKKLVREGHLVDRDAQLAEKSVVEFIRKMERRSLTSKGWHSIFSLMRDGGALAKELAEIARLRDRDEQIQRLAGTISPYLEVVSEDARCPHTGFHLRDIWRYFRHTWVNAYNSLPGRSMMLLVRDAAGPNHPVIGIAALGSAVAQQKVRDRWIGWDQETFVRRLMEEPSGEYGQWIVDSIDTLIRALYLDDLLSEGICHLIDIDYPTDKVIQRLANDSEKAIRQHRLYPMAAQHKAHQAKPEGAVQWGFQARTSLFRSKRSKRLAQLLRVRQLLQGSGLKSGSKAELEKVLASLACRNGIGQLVRMVKAEHVGIDMMDIVVCGAVAPYNILLGGKLVCMLLCSPEVVDSYARRYGEQVSVIASSMKGAPVVRPPSLVLLSTTSLYGVGSSQYNRVAIPCDRVGGAVGQQVKYQELGSSRGYGTYHLSRVTTEIAETLVERQMSGRQVNSIFGEGANPRMRKLRDAFDRIGLPSDELLCHGNPRVVYGIALARNVREVLLGLTKAPSYYLPLSDVEERSAQIAEYWRERWLLGRIGRPGILDAVEEHTLSYPVRHGARVSLPNPAEENVLFPGKE